MASTRCKLRSAVVVAARMLSTVVGAAPAGAEIVPLQDCFGMPAGQLESDELWGGCDSSVNIP